MRLFVGIALPDDVRRDLARLSAGLPGARWVAPESLHLTLRFIGEVTPAGADDLDAVLSGLDAAAFEMRLSGLGTWGNEARQRAVWAAVPANPALEHLHSKVESAVVRAGFGAERRKFTPHVTIARLKGTTADRLAAYCATHGGLATEPFDVGSFTVFRSHLGSEGARYEALADYPLRDFSRVGL